LFTRPLPILFSPNGDGNELNYVFVGDTDGTITDLTLCEKMKASFFG